MGDAARQGAESLQFLRLANLALESVLSGEISGNDAEALYPLQREGPGGDIDHYFASFMRDQMIFSPAVELGRSLDEELKAHERFTGTCAPRDKCRTASRDSTHGNLVKALDTCGTFCELETIGC